MNLLSSYIKSFVSENKSKTYNRLTIFDFDGSLMNTPEPEEGRREYEKKTGEPWQFRGWWSRPESLEKPFDIDPVGWVYKEYKKAEQEKTTYVVVLTGRDHKLRSQVKRWLDEYDINPNEFILKKENPYRYESTADYKKRTIKKLIDRFPDLNSVEIWEDQQDNIDSIAELDDELDIPIIVNKV